jgi:hypothetical protein
MSNPIATAVLKSGLVSKEQLAEFRRWRAPIEIPEELPSAPKTLEEVAETIEEALVSQGYVLTKETDLNLVQQYLATQTQGVLHVEVEVTPEDVDALLSPLQTTADIPLSYGRTPTGEYILPYRGENISKEMTNGRTHLLVNGKRVFFSQADDRFYGDAKAFMVCTQSVVENADA